VGKETEYRLYAEKTRAIAGQLKDRERAKLLKIAEEWDTLASEYERRCKRTTLRIRLPKATSRLRLRPLHLVVTGFVALTSGLLVTAGWMKHLRASRRQERNAPPT
jgi:hypothetical protein